MPPVRLLLSSLLGLSLAGLATAAPGAQEAPAPAAEPADGGAEIHGLGVEVDGNTARVSFELDGAVDDDFVERLMSGLPTGFVYEIELLKDRKRWFDRGLASTSLQVVAMYDAGTRGYLINYKLDGKLVESRLVRELADLERAMTHVDDLPSFELDNLPRAWRLLVRVRAQLGSRKLFFLLPARASTEWRESRKFHSLNELPDRGA